MSSGPGSLAAQNVEEVDKNTMINKLDMCKGESIFGAFHVSEYIKPSAKIKKR
jgi:hypothetical protein